MAITLRKYQTKRGKDIPGLYIDGSGIFYARKRIGAATPRKSLDTTVETTAILKLHDALKELEEKELAKRNAEKEIKEGDKLKTELVRDFYAKMYLQKTVEELRPATLRRITTIWENNIEPFWGDLRPSDVDKDKVTEFMAWHKKTKPGVQFQNTFKYLGNIFRIMVESGALEKDKAPVLVVPKPEQKHHKSKKGRLLPMDDFKTILNAVKPEYQLIFELAYFTGMRKMEIGAMRQNQVIKRKNHYFFDFSWQDTKTGLERTPPIPEFLLERVLDLKSNGSHFLFPAPTDPQKHISSKMIDMVWKGAKTAAKIDGRLRFHDMRHTATTNLVKDNINPLVIATHLGMTIKTLQERYLNLQPEDLLVINRSMLDLYRAGFP